MALIKCPDCERKVSDTADACPNCGFSIKSAISNKREISHPEMQELKNNVEHKHYWYVIDKCYNILPFISDKSFIREMMEIMISFLKKDKDYYTVQYEKLLEQKRKFDKRFKMLLLTFVLPLYILILAFPFIIWKSSLSNWIILFSSLFWGPFYILLPFILIDIFSKNEGAKTETTTTESDQERELRICKNRIEDCDKRLKECYELCDKYQL